MLLGAGASVGANVGSIERVGDMVGDSVVEQMLMVSKGNEATNLGEMMIHMLERNSRLVSVNELGRVTRLEEWSPYAAYTRAVAFLLCLYRSAIAICRILCERISTQALVSELSRIKARRTKGRWNETHIYQRHANSLGQFLLGHAVQFLLLRIGSKLGFIQTIQLRDCLHL